MENYLPKILEKLKTLRPKKVILFGSCFKKETTLDSDIDLLIVLDINKIPSSYDEKLEIKLKVRRVLRDINQKVPLDILVFTIPEYEIFVKSDSSFAKELRHNGRIVYEKTS